MTTDGKHKHIAVAYRTLGLQPGVSPLAAKRRYRDLIKESHPDRFPPGSPLQVEATRITQDINDAYRTIKEAAIHHEVPLRRPTAAAQSVSSNVAHFEDFTLTDRLFAGFVGVLLGAFLDLAIMSEQAVVWIAVPLIAGVLGALFGWRAIEVVIRVLWWLV